MSHDISADVVQRRFLQTDVAKTAEGTVKGYGCRFNATDSYGTRFAPGCFSKSLSEWRTLARTMPMYVNHNNHSPIGGWLDLREDDQGLVTEGQIIASERDRMSELFDLRVVMGESIGFRPQAWEVADDDTVTFTEVRLVEISLVTANSVPGSLIDFIRSEQSYRFPTNIRDFETLLRRLGATSKQATSIASGGFKTADHRDDAAEITTPTSETERDQAAATARALRTELTLMRLNYGLRAR